MGRVLGHNTDTVRAEVAHPVRPRGVLGIPSLYYGHTAQRKRLGWSQALKNDLEWCAKNVDFIP